jgi:hypothetical protein
VKSVLRPRIRREFWQLGGGQPGGRIVVLTQQVAVGRWYRMDFLQRGGHDRRAIRVFRAVHVGIAAVELACLSYIWFSAITRRRDPVLALAVGTLCFEGVGLIIGRGNCPLGPFQRHLGDPVPMFEVFLPKRAAKMAVPVLAGVTVAGLAAVALRRPQSD